MRRHPTSFTPGGRSLLLCLTALALVAPAARPAVAMSPPRPEDLAALDPMVAERIDGALRSVVEEPGESQLWLDLGRLYHAHELTDLAERCYREAVRLEPEGAKAWYSLALAQAELGLPEAALEALEHVIRLAPGYSPALWRKGRWLAELGREREAEEAFQRSVEVDPDDPGGQVGLARMLIQRGEVEHGAVCKCVGQAVRETYRPPFQMWHGWRIH